jgi:hypothetical protein
MTAMDDLNSLLSPLPGYGVLTEPMKQVALNGAVIPDGAGVWPGQPGYQNTYDVYFAAISLIGFLQAQPVVRQVSSEGTSTAVDAPDWSGIIAFYRAQSIICGATPNPVLGILPIPEVPHVVRTDMSGRWDQDGDVDTDMG